MKQIIKRMLVSVGRHHRVTRLFSPMTRQRATVFMLHRFEDERLGIRGHSPGSVMQLLARLRDEGYQFVSLRRVFDGLAGNGAPLNNAVAFTMDDGFEDQLRIGVPIFQHFDCPVTIFLITGFTDGEIWPWDAQLEHVFRNATADRLTARIRSRSYRYDLGDRAAIRRSLSDFRQHCKELPGKHLSFVVQSVAEAAGVPIPQSPPPSYRPLTWDAARAAEAEGVTFGSHTATHRILTRLDRGELCQELETSWRRLKDELSNPLPIVCYPNGRFPDFGAREMALVKRLGFQGAVTAEPGYADRRYVRANDDARFMVGRFAWPGDELDMLQYCSWIEDAKRYVPLLR